MSGALLEGRVVDIEVVPRRIAGYGRSNCEEGKDPNEDEGAKHGLA